MPDATEHACRYGCADPVTEAERVLVLLADNATEYAHPDCAAFNEARHLEEAPEHG